MQAEQLSSSWWTVTIVLFLCVFKVGGMDEIIDEKCLSETFAPRCAINEVIQAQSAYFGRMSTGRCMPEHYGIVGCSVDVLPFIDAKCSGRSRCAVDVVDAMKLGAQPCPEGFSSFLQVAYTCRKVVHLSSDECVHGQMPITGGSALLMPYPAPKCNWSIEAQPGQSINITLHFFQYEPRYSDIGSTLQSFSRCLRLAVIYEKRKTIHVCAKQEKVRNVYLSEGSRILVDTSTFTSNDTLYTYLLEYKAVGCSLPKLPFGLKMIRDGQSLKVECNTSGIIWTTKCTDGQWSNLKDISCPKDRIWPGTSYDWASTKGMAIVVSLGVLIGFVLGLTLLGCGVLCIKRCGRKPRGLRRQETQDGCSRVSDVVNPLVTHRDAYFMEQAPTDTWPGRSASMHSLRGGGPARMGRSGSGTRLPSTIDTRATLHMYESPQFKCASKDQWHR